MRWVLFALVVVAVAWTVPLFEDHRRYFSGDTEAAYLGWWYEFGTSLIHGHWPFFDAQAGVASNAIAEGQWGLFSPLTALIGIGSTVAPNLVWFATAVKFITAAVAVVGTYLLAKSYQVRPPLAAVAATAVPLCGHTLVLDGPAWVNGLFVSALLPWAWWGLRRTMLHGRNPAPALVAGYLVVTTGYVYGTIYLALVVGASLVEALLLRRRDALIRALLLGVCFGLVALTVYLPGVLTAGVTKRAGLEVGGEGPWRMLVSTYFLSGQPVLVPGADLLVGIPGGPTRMVPFTFTVWFLPLLAWVRPSRLRGEWRALSGLVLVLVVLVAWSLGPNTLGPIRWPSRIMPIVTLTLALTLVVLLERTLLGRPSRTRFATSLVWCAVAAVASVVVEPSLWRWEIGGGLLVALGIIAARRAAGTLPNSDPGGPARISSVLLLGSLFVATYTLIAMPELPALQRSMPSSRADYGTPASAAQGDIMVVGAASRVPTSYSPARARSLLYGSAWYLSDRPVRNLYSTIGFLDYNRRYCVRYNGDSCPRALGRLLAVEPGTGLRQVDLQSISTLILVRREPGGDAPGPRHPPVGWHRAAQDRFTVTWVRNTPVPTAGGVVWTSRGTRLHQVSQSDTSTSFVVDAAPTGGGRVVLSRLAWPGYRIDGASFARPLEGYQMVVDVPGSATGRTVTVTFRPPGWTLEMLALILALVLGGGWSAVAGSRHFAIRGRHGPGS